MDKAKAAAIIQAQFDLQTRESYGSVTMPVNMALDLVVATWRAADAVFAQRMGAPPLEPFTLAAMALMHGAVTPSFATDPGIQAYFVRALFQITRNLDDMPLSPFDRDVIDATLTAASDLAPHWFPKER